MVFYSELIVIDGLVCLKIVLKFLADIPKANLARLGLHTFGSEEKESGNWNLLVPLPSHRTVYANYLQAFTQKETLAIAFLLGGTPCTMPFFQAEVLLPDSQFSS